MLKIYKQIWEKAKPYYEKGRAQDVDHIEWMMKAAEKVCKAEGIDESLLLPLVILHDVGYAEVSRDNPFKKSLRKYHMKEGAMIARKILTEFGFEREKIKQIAYYVSVHDKWALGDNFVYKDPVLGVFTDLDYLWMETPKGFESVRKMLGKDKKQMIEFLKDNEKLTNRPFCIKTTKEMHEKYMKEYFK